MTFAARHSAFAATLMGSLLTVWQVPGQAPYFTDFESGVGTEWSLTNWETSETSSFTRFTGRFSNESQILTLTNLSIGESYTVGFDFYAIDSLDGGTTGSGDYFNVIVDGVQEFHETFSNFNQDNQT